jgi:hypothetical protein
MAATLPSQASGTMAKHAIASDSSSASIRSAANAFPAVAPGNTLKPAPTTLPQSERRQTASSPADPPEHAK